MLSSGEGKRMLSVELTTTTTFSCLILMAKKEDGFSGTIAFIPSYVFYKRV